MANNEPIASHSNRVSNQQPYYTKANKNTLLGVLATGLSLVINAIIMPILVVRFGADNWARYSFFSLYVAVLSFVESSLQLYTSQLTATAKSNVYDYEWKNDKNIFGLYLLMLVIAGGILALNGAFGLTKDTNLNYILTLALFNMFPRAISSTVKGTLQGQNSQIKYYAVTTLLNLCRPLFLLLLILLLKPNIITLVIFYVIYSLVEMTVYLWLKDPPETPSSEPKANHSSDLHLLLPLLTSNGLSVLTANLDKLLVFGSASLISASNYTFASTLAGLLYIFVNVAIGSYGPKFKELFLRDNQEKMKEYFYKLSFINNLLIMLAIAGFYFLGSWVMQPLSKKIDIKNVIDTFLYLGLASLLSSNLWVPGIIATSMGKATFSVKTNFLFILIYLVCYNEIVKYHGPFVFAKSMLISAAVTGIVGMYHFRYKILNISMSRYVLLSILYPVLLVGVLITPFWCLNRFFNSFWVNLTYLGVVSFAIGGAWIRYKSSTK